MIACDCFPCYKHDNIKLVNFVINDLVKSKSAVLTAKTEVKISYRKIPKISPGAYIFQRPFLRGLFLEGLIFGGAHLRRELCVSNSIGLAL